MFNTLAIASALGVALLTSYLIMLYVGKTSNSGKYASIDGLRGYLAFFVFMHHSFIWYTYLHTGKWISSGSNLISQLGQSSVALFFMITSFLFFSKLLDSREKGMDWTKLFVSRFLRLFPMYFFTISIVLVIVLILTHGNLYVSPLKLVKQISHWIAFTVLQMPDINGLARTNLIIAGVSWTLPYEWLFYLSLPISALLLKIKTPFILVVACISAMAVLLIPISNNTSYLLLPFLSGIIAAKAVRIKNLTNFANTVLASILVFSLLCITYIYLPNTRTMFSIILLTLAFTLIACGNTIFGILSHPVSRFFGEMTYSVYLLHGLVLFITFKFILGFKESVLMSSFLYWTTVICTVPIVLLLSRVTFQFIELPPMTYATKISNNLIRIVSRRNEQKMA